MNEIEISPIYQNLLLEIEALTKEYSLLWEEKERLVTQKKPLLLVTYNTEIGKYILAYLNKHLYFLKLKRKIELLQMSINQNKKVDLKQVEQSLNEEFKDWIDKVSSLENEVRSAQQTTFELVKEDEFKKIQELYRKLVRKLHPDINKDLTDNQKILWNRIQEAYKNMNLEELQTLEILAENNSIIEEITSLEVLKQKKELLWGKLQNLAKTIEEVKQSFPFSLEKELSNPNWIQSEIEIYINKEKEIDSILPEYENRYQLLLYQIYGVMGQHPENL